MNDNILNDLITCKQAINNIKQKMNDSYKIKKIIKTLVERDCPDDLLLLISDTNFNFAQVCEIIHGFENGLSFEEISVYAYYNLHEDVMNNIRKHIKSISKNYSQYEIHKYCGNKYLSLSQLDIVKEGLRSGLSEEEVDLYANKRFNCDQMRSIKNGLEHGLGERVKIYADHEIDSESMNLILEGLLSGLSEEKISKIYTNKKFNNRQRKIILQGLLSGLSEEEINIYALPDFDSRQMEVIYDNLINNTDRRLIELVANPYFHAFSMEYKLNKLKKYDKRYIDLILTKRSMKVIDNMCDEESYRLWLYNSKEQEILKIKEQINDNLSEFNQLYHKNKPLKIKIHGDLDKLTISVTLPKYIYKYEKRVQYLNDILRETLTQIPNLHDYEILKTKDISKSCKHKRKYKRDHGISNYYSQDILEAYNEYQANKSY